MEQIWYSFLSQDIGLPLISSLVTGMLIGFEREARDKPAGLRTHSLVCFASTILMLAAARQGQWTVDFIDGSQVVTDPTRMAHGVLTGIGFLCAGVIFREGVSIHGLTTAASLWTTSALGLLFGIGMYWLAVSGAIATLGVLGVLRLIKWMLPGHFEARVEVAAAAGSDFDSRRFAALLGELGLKHGIVARTLVANRHLQFATRATCRNEATLDRLTEALAAVPSVVGFRITSAESGPAAAPLEVPASVGSGGAV